MERKKVIRYFSSLQFLLYASTSLWGYCIIYFRSLGFSSSEIGFMNAAGTGLSMVLLPLVGILGDRLRSPGPSSSGPSPPSCPSSCCCLWPAACWAGPSFPSLSSRR